MKKLLSLIFAVILIFSFIGLVGCGKQQNQSNSIVSIITRSQISQSQEKSEEKSVTSDNSVSSSGSLNPAVSENSNVASSPSSIAPTVSSKPSVSSGVSSSLSNGSTNSFVNSSTSSAKPSVSSQSSASKSSASASSATSASKSSASASSTSSSSNSGSSGLPETVKTYVFNASSQTASSGTEGDFSWKCNSYSGGLMKIKSTSYHVTLSNISSAYVKVEVKGNCIDSSSAQTYPITATFSDGTTEVQTMTLPTDKALGVQTATFNSGKTITKIVINGPSNKNLGVESVTVTTGEGGGGGSQTQPEQKEYFTVEFDSQGGSLVSSQSIESGKSAQKPMNPTKSGYTFKYWSLGGAQFDFSSQITSNITLVAVWEEESSVIPTTSQTYLDGILYGDSDFKAKIATADKREVATVNDIPTDAIFVANASSNGNGSEGSPFNNLQNALSKATSQVANGGSGVILMRAGTYEPTYFYSLAQGNKDNYIVVTNYPGETVKISPTQGSAETTGLFHLGTSNYVIIEGLIFCDNIGTTSAKGIGTGGSGHTNIIIKNNEFTNIRVNTGANDRCNASIINFRGNVVGKPHTNILIYGNYIHDVATGWSESITFVGNCENINVIKNTLKDTGNIGIDIAGNWGDIDGSAEDQARKVVVRGNVTSGCNSPYARSYGLYCDGARDVIFENNISFGSQGGIEVGAENPNDNHPVENIIIRNNLVYNNTEKGIAVGGYREDVGWVKNVEIYNNTIVDNGNNSDENNGQLTLSKVNGVKVYNNVISVSSANMYIYYESSSISASYRLNVEYKNNLYFNGSSQETICFKIQGESITGMTAFKGVESTARFGNPLFTNPALADYTLQAGSPAIDVGLAPTYANYDLAGNLRIVNSTIDLGCYEKQ